MSAEERRRGWTLLLGCFGVAVLLLVIVGVVAAALGGGGDVAQQQEQPRQERAQNQGQGQQQGQQEQQQGERSEQPRQEQAQNQESKPSFGDGTYQVGTDIQPGSYRSSGGSGCYYERLRDFTGGLNSIIANGNTSAPTIVAIKPTDAGFQSQSCGTWTKLE